MSDLKSTVFLIHYDQIVRSSLENCVANFSKTTGLSVEALQKIAYMQGGMPLNFYPEAMQNMIKDNGVIYHYKTGQIDTETFIEKMLDLLDQKTDKAGFVQAWNSQCTLSLDVIDELKQLAELQKQHGFHFHVIAGTNPLQDAYILEQLKSHDIGLSFTATYSFDKGELDTNQIKEMAINKDIPELFKDAAYDLVNLMDDKQSLLSTMQRHVLLSPTPVVLIQAATKPASLDFKPDDELTNTLDVASNAPRI